ncbi:MAG: hypothetical protein JW973_03325 [Bacteroidales bacterium]|nr:hypothetical protein [Bacteroidales bacterium]
MKMNFTAIETIILKALHNVHENKLEYEQLYGSADKSTRENEFLFFIKPELTMKSPLIKFDLILKMLFEQFKKFRLVLKDMRILSAQYLKTYNIIAQHYGVINAVSASPRVNMTDDAKERFQILTGKSINEVRILGSLEIHEQYPDFSSSSLDYLWQNVRTEKLAGGTYQAKVFIDGEELYIINGFHPRQLEHYIQPGRCIITMTLSGDLSWKEARNAFIGLTNPEDAQPGSLRNILLRNQSLYGLQTVSSSRNGFHLSAGPIEGLVELMRYTSNFSTNNIYNYTDFSFGQKLAEKFGDAITTSILQNMAVDTGGKKITIFDLTEEKNSGEALDILERYLKA